MLLCQHYLRETHAGDDQVNLPGACTEVEVSVRETTRGPPVQRSPSTTSAPGDAETSCNATNHPSPNGDSYTNSG